MSHQIMTGFAPEYPNIFLWAASWRRTFWISLQKGEYKYSWMTCYLGGLMWGVMGSSSAVHPALSWAHASGRSVFPSVCFTESESVENISSMKLFTTRLILNVCSQSLQKLTNIELDEQRHRREEKCVIFNRTAPQHQCLKSNCPPQHICLTGFDGVSAFSQAVKCCVRGEWSRVSEAIHHDKGQHSAFSSLGRGLWRSNQANLVGQSDT